MDPAEIRLIRKVVIKGKARRFLGKNPPVPTELNFGRINLAAGLINSDILSVKIINFMINCYGSGCVKITADYHVLH